MVSCQKGPTRHAYAWQIGPFLQDTIEMWSMCEPIDETHHLLIPYAPEAVTIISGDMR